MMHDSSSVRAGVLGANGYTGRELIRILAGHPRVEIGFATSESEAGTSLRKMARGAPEIPLVRAADAPIPDVDVVFSCLPHGASLEWVGKVRSVGKRAIDLSADLRVPDDSTPEWARGVIYGLTELHREQLRGSELVANPGCYPTAATLSIVPLARRGLIADGPVIINAASGVTGAGRSPKRELLFAEVGEDFRAYAVGNVHRHLAEMRSAVGGASSNGRPELVFTPHLLPVRRGILETIYIPVREGFARDDALQLYREDYDGEPFVQVLTEGHPSLADVVGTNQVLISIASVQGVTTPLLMVIAAIDNLVKGAAGQAVQNLNAMMGWAETEGLS